ncbi:MAG: hypothetical protein JWM24_826 [Solirubrobacterales bacterium]|nr:hypothetical protein [Solirubrobacterales bacterium]
MRDFLLNEALKRLATEAATRFSSLVASGDQIPFDVSTESGDDSAFYSYVPLTSRFVEERAGELCSLPSFGPAREAAVGAGLASPYLEARGESVPADPGERAERMLTVFISALWEGSTEFSLDRARLDSALSMLDAEGRDADDAEVVIVPVVGLRMSAARLQLPHGVRIVRSDAIDAPIDAMRSEGMGRASWEPQYLAVADQHEEEGAEAALNQLRELISVMRLFKGGGIGLGPYAFAPTGEDCWRRIATGAPATRPGGYRLSEEEAGELIELAGTLEARPDPDSALTWAVGRFEMGCERESALDGLSDHLLALRAVLEGHGPVGASLPMRAAALISDDSLDRIEARGKVEDTLELERALMNGRSLEHGVGLAGWAEEGVRRLLLQAALGELGNDLSTTADETLIATGLDGGDSEIAFTADEEIDAAEVPAPPEIRVEQLSPAVIPPEPIEIEPTEETDMEQETRIMEPIPAAEEIKITATPWLEEVSDERRGDSLEWPAASERDIEHRERIDTPRVRHLFPVPEDADWEVSHLEFDYGHYGGPRQAS